MSDAGFFERLIFFPVAIFPLSGKIEVCFYSSKSWACLQYLLMKITFKCAQVEIATNCLFKGIFNEEQLLRDQMSSVVTGIGTRALQVSWSESQLLTGDLG